MYLFVYGIFKGGGQRYSSLFKGCQYIGTATAPGFVLLDHVGPAAMVPGQTLRVTDTVAKGEVIEVPDARVDEILDSLDRIETNGRAYIRAKINVHLDECTVQVEAYAYLWIEYYNAEDLVTDGSWSQPFRNRI